MKKVMTLGPFDLWENGINVRGRPTPEEWQKLTNFLLSVSRAHCWWLGDVVKHGERLMGDDFFNRVDVAQNDVDVLVRNAGVARRVIRANRNPRLYFSHHREVASLSGALQRQILSEAADEALTSMDVRKLVAEAKRNAR